MTIPKEILSSIQHVAPLSQSALRLMELTTKPNYRLSEVVGIIQNDAVLTGNVLRVVNSAAFARKTPIETITRAVPLLGEKMLTGMALGLCAAQALDHPLEGYDGERGSLWRHSLRTAIAARELAAFVTVEIGAEVAYTAGILHDVGKVVISDHLQGRAREALHQAESYKIGDYLAAERDLLSTDHCEVGEAMANKWRLPEALSAAINWHHNPREAPEKYRPLAYLVHLGDFAAMMGGAGTGADTLLYRLDSEYNQIVKISLKELDQVMLKTDAEYERLVAITFPDKESRT